MNFLSKTHPVLLSLAFASPSYAALIAVEQFDYAEEGYSPGQLNGGSGWGTSWVAHSTQNGSMDIISQVSFGSLQTAGGMRSAMTDERNGRSINAASAQTINTEITNDGSVFVGFLAQDGGQFAGAAGFTFFDDAGAGVGGNGNGRDGIERLFFGASDTFDGGNYYWSGTGVNGSTQSIGSGIAGNTLAFVMFEFDYTDAGTDVAVDLFTAGDLTTPAATESFSINSDFRFDTIRLTRDMTIDEIRIGTTANDVMPVPEPGASLLLGLSGMLLLLRRRG